MKNFSFLLIITILISFSATSQDKLLWYTFSSVSGDTVPDESGNGNNALLVGNTYVAPIGIVRLKDSAYLDAPAPVIHGLNDFTIYMRVYMDHFHSGTQHATNTIFSASSSSCTYCLGLAYSKPNNEWQLTLNGVMHSFPQELFYFKGVIEIVRDAGIVSLINANQGGLLGTFTDDTPLDASTFIFGQHEQCLGGCFSKSRSLFGGLNEIRVYDTPFYLKQAGDANAESSLSVFPNPFSSGATISFTLQQDSHTAIELFDLAGRKIETLLDENLFSGTHAIQLNREVLTSGIYLLQFKASAQTFTEKLVVE